MRVIETCKCYREREETRTYTDFQRGYILGKTGRLPETNDYTEVISYCTGTRECDPCKCGGNPLKCDFYPEKRKRAKANEKD